MSIADFICNLFKKTGWWRKEIVNETMIVQSQKKGKPYYEFGRMYFGPFLLGFTRWLCGQIKKNKIDKLFFFARDGYMMEKAFRLIEQEKVYEKYVYFSRKSIRQALLHQCRNYAESLRYISSEKYITFGEILECYGFDENERIELAKKYSIPLEKDFKVDELVSNEQIKNIYNDLQDEINRKSQEQDALLIQYIQQLEISGRIGIVDIGWQGSMQYYLETFIKHHNLDISFVGFYVGIQPRKKLNGEVHGFLYDRSNFKLRKKVLCFAGGLERLFQSLEGSTYGYMGSNGEIRPVLNDYEYADSPEIQTYILDMQEGAMEFVKENKKCMIANEKLAKKLIQFGVSPTLEEVKLFSPFYNTDGIRSYYVSQKPIYKYGFHDFMHAFSNSPWKNGFLKSVFKIPFPYYWIYMVMKK